MTEFKRLVKEVRYHQRVNEEMEWFDDEARPTSQYDATHEEWYVYVPLMRAQQALVDYVLEHVNEFRQTQESEK